ncbi:hypothetical protein HYU20_01120, partial [Candidatus Woesearchaeota archaeon]|nr:hypothetical protein [Candidatus Woesearchaeota archaeon]
AAAAKELGVGIQTVEAWANFLEEDGLVTVKYKFTTPYVTVPEVPKAQQRRQEAGPAAEVAEFAQLKTELGGMQDILSKAGDEKTAGEFGMLKQTYATLLYKLKGAHDKLITQAEIAPQKKVKLNELVASLDSELRTAAQHASEGRFDQASYAYSKLYEQARFAIEELNRLYDQITTLQSIKATKDYKDLLGKAYELMQEGKVEEAKDLYEKLNFANQNLAKEFIEKKRQMEDDLVKLNKDLAKNVDQLNLEKLKRTRERITALLNVGNKLLRKGEFDTAESYYLAIKREYVTLPSGFIEEKKEMQEKVLAFYSALAKQREKAIRQKFDSAARQIDALVKQIREMLKEYKVEPAIQVYRQVKQLYSILPAGFLKEKAAIQEMIVPLHTSITSIYTQESLNSLKARSAEIATLLGAMNAHTARGELKEAEAAYEKVKQLYRKMPKGFLHEETTLQDEIVQAYEAYLKKAKQMETSSSSSTISSITRLLEEAEAQVKRNDFGSANKAYAKIMALYSTLPPGFAVQKTGVREKVLHLYKTLLSATPAIQIPQIESPQITPQQVALQPRSITSEITPVYEKEREAVQAPVQETREVPVAELTAAENAEEESVPENAPQQEAEQSPAEAKEAEASDYGDEDIESIDSEIADIEKKIEELKSVGKATVKFPQHDLL